MILPFTPRVARRELLHGQGTESYSEYNARPQESVYGQTAPDPIRQSDAPCRPSRRPIVIMSTNPADWNTGFPDAFLPYMRGTIRRLQPAGRQLGVRAQNSVGIRPNIDRGQVAAYGSLFQLDNNVYDESRM